MESKWVEISGCVGSFLTECIKVSVPIRDKTVEIG